MSKSNFLEDAVLNYVLRGVAMPAFAAGLHVALFTVAPTDAGGGTEVTGGAYARAALTRVAGSWSVPADNSGVQRSTNAAAITFASPTAGWGTVVAVGLMDAATAGNLAYWSSLGTPRAINSGDQAPSFAIGALGVSEG